MAVQSSSFMAGDVPAYQGNPVQNLAPADKKMLCGRKVRQLMPALLLPAGLLVGLGIVVGSALAGSYISGEAARLTASIAGVSLGIAVSGGGFWAATKMMDNNYIRNYVFRNLNAKVNGTNQYIVNETDERTMTILFEIVHNKRTTRMNEHEDFSEVEKQNYKIAVGRLEGFAIQELAKLTDDYTCPANITQRDFRIYLENMRAIINAIGNIEIRNARGYEKFIQLAGASAA